MAKHIVAIMVFVLLVAASAWVYMFIACSQPGVSCVSDQQEIDFYLTEDALHQ